MNLDTFHTVIEWFQAHSAITISIVFLTALSESLAVVGLLVPGAVLMVIFGALIASGYLEFLPVFTAAVLGAVAGDCLSYWLGKYYQQQLKSIWPLRRYPELIAKGESFFTKHGGKSILLGRFIGPIRPVIPAIAGMMNMPVHVFLLINIFSALLWAPLYLLPGILLGASFELASQLAGRFALMLLVFVILLWTSYQLFIFLYRKVTPHTDQFIFSIMNWNSRHPFLANITGSLIDPDRKEIRGLSILTLLLLIGSFVSAILIDYAMQTGPVHNINLLVFNLVESMQSPPFDWLLLWLSNLGARDFLLIIVIGLSTWLALQKQWIAIAYLVASYLIPLLILLLLKWSLTLPAPPVLLSGLVSFNLPSGHTALALSVYGFIAILFAKDFSERIRLSIYIGVAWLVGSIGFTRLYFSTHWLTDVVAGFTLGLAWLSLLAIAYRRHHKQDILAITTTRVSIAFLLILAASFPYQPPTEEKDNGFPQYYVMPYHAWHDSGWQSLDKKRNDLRNKNQHPFTLQWVADSEQIKQYLDAKQWLEDDDSSSYLHWLNPLADIQQLPILAQVHKGIYDSLRFYKVMPGETSLLVIRLWPTDVLVERGTRKIPLWTGNVSYMKVKDLFLIRYLYTENSFNPPLDKLKANLTGLSVKAKLQPAEKNENWDGTVLLVSE